MTKRNNIIYWTATIWLALGMLSTGVVQLLQMNKEVAFILALGYPTYVISLLGFWKILGTLAVISPGLPLIKEWAYAGFFLTMTGALYSHIVSDSPINEIIPCLLLLVLTILSWHFRSPGRKIAQLNQK